MSRQEIHAQLQDQENRYKKNSLAATLGAGATIFTGILSLRVHGLEAGAAMSGSFTVHKVIEAFMSMSKITGLIQADAILQAAGHPAPQPPQEEQPRS